MNRGQWNIRKTVQREQQIKKIQAVTGTNSFATVIDYALARAISEIDQHEHTASPVVLDLLKRLDQLEQLDRLEQARSL